MDVDDFLRAADLLPEPMILASGSGEILAANRALLRVLGADADALIGRPLADFVADPPEHVEGFLRLGSRTRSLVPGSLTLRLPDGSRIAYRAEGATYRPRSSEAGPAILVRLIPRDRAVARFLALDEKIEELSREIRRRRLVEAELWEQREWFRVVLSSIGDAVIVTDTDRLILFMNAVAEDLTGWPIAEARGLPLEEIFRIVNEETRLAVESPVGRVIREGIIVGLANHTILLARDGREWHIDDSAAPIRRDDGRLLGVVLIFRDVGERRLLERELRDRALRLVEEDRRKNEFLAMLAHELRNPLAPLQNAIRLIRSQSREEGDFAWSTEIMERQVRHLSRLVDDLLDVSRVIHGKIELRPERVLLDRLVASAVEVARPLIEARGHDLTVSMPDEPIPLEVDPARIEQVLTNLLNNAAKYTGDGGRIRVEATRDGGHAEIRVLDSGVGISPELLGSIFDLFTQADHSLARSQGGLGIGLTLVRTLVLLHGGAVEARSRGPGLGSEFLVRLPMAAGDAAPAEAPRADPAPDFGPRRVLVVDDLVDSAKTLGRLIALMGHEVRIAHDGPSAIAEAQRFGPDVVLLDIGLPGMDGYEVARRLSTDPGRQPPILIALTGYGQRSDREESRRAGFSEHLIKPVDLDRLTDLLARRPPDRRAGPREPRPS